MFTCVSWLVIGRRSQLIDSRAEMCGELRARVRSRASFGRSGYETIPKQCDYFCRIRYHALYASATESHRGQMVLIIGGSQITL